jgi:predicted nuclease of restriction endonuclease-like (RecB) superfamily
MPDSLFPRNDTYEAFLHALKERIRTAQVRAALAVNAEVILLYWQIGREILARQQQQGWGSKVVEQLGKDLRREFPRMKGLSARNLNYMKAFAEAYPDEQILQQVAAKIPWFHNCILLQKVKDPEERLWYAKQTVEYGWSRNVLALQIDTELYRRQGSVTTNFTRTLPAPQSDLANQLLKDPYSFEFLDIHQNAVERELERALINRIRDFLLELGAGFAYVGSQYPLEVGGEDFYIDLLFYHLKLHCYVVIELKTTDFRPEYSGKVNFYLSAVNNLLRTEVDNPSIGIILCRSKNKTIVEYALGTVQNPIGVSTYKLRDDLPPALQESLPTVEQLEIELETAAAEIEAQTQDKPHSDKQV